MQEFKAKLGFDSRKEEFIYTTLLFGLKFLTNSWVLKLGDVRSCISWGMSIRLHTRYKYAFHRSQPYIKLKQYFIFYFSLIQFEFKSKPMERTIRPLKRNWGCYNTRNHSSSIINFLSQIIFLVILDKMMYSKLVKEYVIVFCLELFQLNTPLFKLKTNFDCNLKSSMSIWKLASLYPLTMSFCYPL